MHKQSLLILGFLLASGLLLMVIQKIRLSRRQMGVCPPDLAKKSKKALGILAIVYTILVLVLWANWGLKTILEWGVEGIFLVCILWALVITVRNARQLASKKQNVSEPTNGVPHKR